MPPSNVSVKIKLDLGTTGCVVVEVEVVDVVVCVVVDVLVVLVEVVVDVVVLVVDVELVELVELVLDVELVDVELVVLVDVLVVLCLRENIPVLAFVFISVSFSTPNNDLKKSIILCIY